MIGNDYSIENKISLLNVSYVEYKGYIYTDNTNAWIINFQFIQPRQVIS
jgi:hypothetical protein